jgi:rhodanese-related sulfurtransferase
MASEKLYAVFDVRERGEFNDCQIANATSLPRSQIEFRSAELVPNRTIPLVLYDQSDGRVELAARAFANLGYTDVSLLEGGLSAWKNEKFSTVSGVNVPSKAFGEKVHHERRLPEITAEELKKLKDQGAELLILDTRTPEEYQRFCIPGGNNVPGGELVHWADALGQRPNLPVVVNCAGRTRSIIGTATLSRLGLKNVRALRNGTMGWVLAGYDLELKPQRGVFSPPPVSREKAAELASRVAKEEEISFIEPEALRVSPGGDTGVAYMIDVRSEAEYEDSHIPGSLHVPGGQAVQRADDFIAVRNGRIVFISDRSARAVMAAYWYRQMGFRNVTVLAGGLDGWRAAGRALVSGLRQDEPLGLSEAKKAAHLLTSDEARAWSQAPSVFILDVGSSADYESGHMPGAHWISRGWLELKIERAVPDKTKTILISCSDGKQSIFAARTFKNLGYKSCGVVDGGVKAWTAAGFPTEKGLTSCLCEANDVVVSPSIKGDKAAMRRYLDWEIELEKK